MLFRMTDFEPNLIDMINDLNDEQLEKLHEYLFYLIDIRRAYEEGELDND